MTTTTPPRGCDSCRLAWSDPGQYAQRHGLPDPNQEWGMTTHRRVWDQAFNHCGHPTTWQLATIPELPASTEAWPACHCGSEKLVTSWQAPVPTGTPVLYSSACCLDWSLSTHGPDRVDSGIASLSPDWRDALLLRYAGYEALHALNRDPNAPPTPAAPLEQLALF